MGPCICWIHQPWTVFLIFNPAATRVVNQPAAIVVPAHGADGPGHLCFRATGEEIEQWRAKPIGDQDAA